MDDKPDLKAVLEYYGCHEGYPDRSGWQALHCPFHGDRAASASVNFALGKFKCFACDYHGDSLDLIMKQEGMSLRDAVSFARDHLGYEGRGVRKAVPQRYRPSWREDDD